jgi:hypothetical protein
MGPDGREAKPVSYMIRCQNETESAHHNAAVTDLEFVVILTPPRNLQPPGLLKYRKIGLPLSNIGSTRENRRQLRYQARHA